MSSSAAITKAPLWLLVLITISGTLAMHMFVPALPDAGRSLGADAAAMQMTISVYILGLGFGQLIYGPFSDALGRRPVLIVGLALYTLAGVVAAMVSGVDALIAARLIQAFGGCAGLALGRAIVRDTARPEEALADLALLNLMMMIGPGFAPLLGSLLATVFGWRAIFLMLAVLGGVTLIYTWRLLPETGRPTGRIRVAGVARDYGRLLRSPSFVGFAVGGGCATTSIYAFIAAAPFIVSEQLHRPLHEVGFYLALVLVGMSLGNIITRRMIRVVRIEHLLVAGNAVSACSAISLLAVTYAGELTIAYAVGFMFLYATGAGSSSPAALTKSLGVDATLIGSAAGLYGAMQMAVGALCTYLVGFGQNPALAAAVVLAVAATLGASGVLACLAL